MLYWLYELQQRVFPRCRTRRRPHRRQVPTSQHGRPERTSVMTEPRKTAKAGAAPVIPLFEFPQFDLPKFDLPKFDLPKFDLPKFELPNVELPAELRAIAEQGIAQVKAAYERAKAAAEQATGVLQHSYAAASEGAAESNRQVVEAVRPHV